MNCETLHLQLDDYLDARLDAEQAARIERHLATCPKCAARLRNERLLRSRLRELPVPAAGGTLHLRLLGPVRTRQRTVRRPQLRLAYALAAALVLTVGLALLPRLHAPDAAQGSKAPVVLVQGNAVQPVRLVFNSPRALSNVTVRLDLPEGVELAKYPGVRELTWQADLQPGANVLALPVVVKGGGGVVTASIGYGAAERRFAVVVHSLSHSSTLESYRLALSGSARCCSGAAGRGVIGHA